MPRKDYVRPDTIPSEDWDKIFKALEKPHTQYSVSNPFPSDLLFIAKVLREKNNEPTPGKDLQGDKNSVRRDLVNARLRNAGLPYRLFSPDHHSSLVRLNPYTDRLWCFGLPDGNGVSRVVNEPYRPSIARALAPYIKEWQKDEAIPLGKSLRKVIEAIAKETGLSKREVANALKRFFSREVDRHI